MTPDVYAVIVITVVVILSIACSESAYNNGVSDGYGYSQDPGCPGYLKAGRYLKKIGQVK